MNFKNNIRRLVTHLKEFNLFHSKPPSTDQHVLKTQRIATRVFILVFILAMDIIVVYTATVRIVSIITVPAPSVTQYQQLNDKYSQTLSCPCTEISIRYKTFLNMSYTFHQVCNSSYVSDQWIRFLANALRQILWPPDFRIIAPSVFQALRTMCETANNSFTLNLLQFYSNSYISSTAISDDRLQAQFQTLINDFMTSTITGFLLSLRLIRDTTHTNALLSAMMTNSRISKSTGTLALESSWLVYETNCSCDRSPSCIQQSVMYPNGNRSAAWQIPNFYVGCFVLEALRKSQLECFFDRVCLTEFISFFEPDGLTQFEPLDAALSQRFLPDMTIENIIDEMMIEFWNWTISHSAYYAACKPASCAYRALTKHSFSYIIATVFGFMGGLVTVLKLLVPRLVWFVRWVTSRTAVDQGNSFSSQRLCRLDLIRFFQRDIRPPDLSGH